MGELLNKATIKVDLKMKGNFLAKVTLNWQDEFEVRFCRIMMRSDGTLWFQAPALKEFGWAKCFGVIDRAAWKKLEEKVIAAFMNELKEKVNEGTVAPELLDRIENAKTETITEVDYEKIDGFLKNTNTHL